MHYACMKNGSRPGLFLSQLIMEVNGISNIIACIQYLKMNRRHVIDNVKTRDFC